MISISQTSRDIIFRAGIALLVVGGVLVLWAFNDFDALPNYLRLALPIPITISYVMLRVDQYRDWASVQGADRGYAIGALLAPPLLLLGSIIWLVAAPGAHG
jgi:hypothetical protein